MPALLTLDSSKEKERIPLLSKGSYRAFFAHPVNEGLVWKVGDHSEEAAWLRLYGSYVMPKLFRKIPVRVKLANSKFPEAGKNLRILEVEKVEMLGEIQKLHLLAMFIILVYMRGQGAALKDVGQSNWGIRRSIGGQPELVLLDAGSWTAVDPGPLKSLAEVSGYRDLLNKHQEVKAAITRLLAQSQAKGPLSDGVWGGGPSGPRRGGGQLVEVPDPAACGGDCSHSGQLCPPAEGLRHPKN